ncbi:MAG TPA: ADP-dependent glucokinase/phosphofructokinase [Methanotrichaceae archaeon]|nr:ADP-dependent glucokinase/phosphofructokinase [Methanotrichaceae archaeon]
MMRVLCAYNVNIDAVTTISGPGLSEIIQNREPTARMPERIKSPGDFLSGLLFCIKSGIGAELLVDDAETAGFIERSFDWSIRMGGNAGNAANALSVLGAEAVVNVPSLTPRQASLFYPGTKVPGPGGETLLEPAAAARPGEDLTHFVIQFGGGLGVALGKETVTSPRENRFIASYDSLNSQQYEDPDFELYAREHIGDADGILIGGLHLATRKETLAPRLEEIESWKVFRPEIFIHAELGGFQSRDVAMYLVENLSSDSLGMNDDELAVLERFSPGWRGIMDAARRLRSRLGMIRVCIHTKEYVASVSHGGIQPEKEIAAMTHGADVAGTLVATGQIKRSVDTSLGPNPAGLVARDQFKRELSAISSGRGAYAFQDGDMLCIAPSLLVEHPKTVVGLGDVMTASDFFCQVRARMGS